MGIEFFKPDDFRDFRNAVSGYCQGDEAYEIANKLLSQNLPRLYEALGMKRVYSSLVPCDEELSPTMETWNTPTEKRTEHDTHTFWMTEPEKLEKEKPDCDHKIKLAFGYCEIDIECDAEAHFDFCPKCGEKFEGEE